MQKFDFNEAKSLLRPDDITINFFSPTVGKKMEMRYSK